MIVRYCITDDNGCVIQWLTKEDQRPEWYANCVNAGLHVLDKKVLDMDVHSDKVDLDRQILKPMAERSALYLPKF